MRYVKYDKIYAHLDSSNDFNIYYRWLSQYCGYFPQVWLSRSHSRITGIRSDNKDKKSFVLFGFEDIQGFYLDYEQWEHFLSFMCMSMNRSKSLPSDFMATLENIDKINELALSGFDEFMKLEEEIRTGSDGDDPDPDYNIFGGARRVNSFDDWRDNFLFVKSDQCVVPSLNLKSAKKVMCQNEKTKKKLRKLGFIEDRIKIQKFKVDWI